MTTALVSGGREHFGWGRDRHLNTDIYDALNVNTLATGQWKKPPKIDPYPRPKPRSHSAAKKPPQRVNLKQLHRQLMLRSAQQNSGK